MVALAEPPPVSHWNGRVRLIPTPPWSHCQADRGINPASATSGSLNFNADRVFFTHTLLRRALFQLRPIMTEKMTDEEWNNELNLRLTAMELALNELDKENIFERQNNRKNMVINVEVMPPNYENTERALRLKKKEILKDFSCDL